MRTPIACVAVMALLFLACGPKQAVVKSGAPVDGAQEEAAAENKAATDGPLDGNLEEFQVTPSGSSASSKGNTK